MNKWSRFCFEKCSLKSNSYLINFLFKKKKIESICSSSEIGLMNDGMEREFGKKGKKFFVRF